MQKTIVPASDGWQRSSFGGVKGWEWVVWPPSLRSYEGMDLWAHGADTKYSP
jgi:hypothetical protein